jgi:hypothetical protein
LLSLKFKDDDLYVVELEDRLFVLLPYPYLASTSQESLSNKAKDGMDIDNNITGSMFIDHVLTFLFNGFYS